MAASADNASGLRCECCGQVMQNIDLNAVIVASRLTPMQVAILRCLAAANGRFMKSEAIADVVYSDRIDGGPDTAASVVGVQILRLRRRLNGAKIQAAWGYRVVGDRPGQGSVGYKLERGAV